MNKQWKINNIDENIAKSIEEKFNISPLVARILSNKDLKDDKEIEKFLRPTRNDFYDPFTMKDMSKAVDRIVKAIEKQEKTVIYGDYDVDGITSSTVLKKYLKERNLDAEIYIPNRLDEGYGLNEDAIRQIANSGCKLMITVDCGITGEKETKIANSLGMDVVITDHHEVPEILPNAVAVVDIKRKDETYAFKGLAGVGVAFKLIQAISIKLDLPAESYLKYLDFVCIGTISDIVPLVDENRVISKLGLMLVKQTKSVGLRTLLESIKYKVIDSNAISFGLSPRINACGRLGHHEVAVDLFLTESMAEASKLVQKLNEFNSERQDIEKRIFEEAVKLSKEEENFPCIIVGNQNWHHGVIGIVSSKITDMYSKPSILLCYEGDSAKGSGRSIKGFDLHEALEKCNDYIEQFGGHDMAVGITIKKENVSKFKDQLEEYAKQLKIEDIVPIINIDEKVNLKDITVNDVKQLNLLEPFGESNFVPLFQINNLKIIGIRTLSEGKHLKLLLKDENGIDIDVIGFGLGYLEENYNIGDRIDIIGTLEINSYLGQESIQLNMKDIRKAIN